MRQRTEWVSLSQRLARVTQLMNLLNLAPDIQEFILWLPPRSGRRITEREMRQIAGDTVSGAMTVFIRSQLAPQPRSHGTARQIAGSSRESDFRLKRLCRWTAKSYG